MRVLGIYRREMFSYFVSPIAYIIMMVFLLMNGVNFYFHLVVTQGYLEPLLGAQFGASLNFWFLCLLIPPLMTMGCFTEEKRSGTYELLVTTGVGEVTLVISKFLAAWTFFVLLWVMVLPLYALLEWVGDPDWGMILSCMAGLVLLGALFTSVGVFASTFTHSQLVAASIAVIGNLLLFFLNFFRRFFSAGDFELRYFNYVSPLHHFTSDFTHGVFDYRYLISYGSLSALFLFLAVKSLERRRWW